MQRVDSRLRSRDEVHNALRLPIIAEVSHGCVTGRATGCTVVAVDPLSPYSGTRIVRPVRRSCTP